MKLNNITNELLLHFEYDETTGKISRKLFSKDETSEYKKEGNILYRGKRYAKLRITYTLMHGEPPPSRLYLKDKSKPPTKDNIGLVGSGEKLVPFKRRVREKKNGLPKGVSKRKDGGYQAHIYLDKLYMIGHFDTIQDASDAHDYCLQENKIFKFSGKSKTVDILELQWLLKRNLDKYKEGLVNE